MNQGFFNKLSEGQCSYSRVNEGNQNRKLSSRSKRVGERGRSCGTCKSYKDEERENILKRSSGCWVGVDGGLALGGDYGVGENLDSGCILKVEPLPPNPTSWLLLVLPPLLLPIPEHSEAASGSHRMCPPR